MQRSAKIDVIILSGGLGTRLRSVLPEKQKVLAEVMGEPFLVQILNWIHKNSLSRIIMALGYNAHQVVEFFENNSHFNTLRPILSIEPKPLGTAGALRYAFDKIKSKTVLVLNGDSFAPIDLESMINMHSKKGAKITLAVTFVENISRFGVVQVGEGGLITNFCEKPTNVENSSGGYINTGIYLFDKNVIKKIPEGKNLSLEHDVFPDYINKGLFGFMQKVPFIDIGIPEDYKRMAQYFYNLEKDVRK